MEPKYLPTQSNSHAPYGTAPVLDLEHVRPAAKRLPVLQLGFGIPWVCMAGIVTLAGVIRLQGLQQRGLIYWDEAKYALEGIRVLGMGHAMLDPHAPVLTGKGIGSARPTHDLLIALSYSVLGVHDYSPLVLAAVASLLCVLLTYLIAARLFSSHVGLMAALFLAVSEYDVIYARSALPEADGNALFLLGVLAWLILSERPIPPAARDIQGSNEASVPFLAGPRRDRSLETCDSAADHVIPASSLLPAFVMGAAFTANFRLAVYIAAFVALDLAFAARRSGPRHVHSHARSWGVGLATVPLLWEVASAVSSAHGTPLFHGDVSGETSYLMQAAGDLTQGKAGLHFTFIPYLQWWVAREHVPLTGLLLAGLCIACRRRSFAWVATTAPIVVALVLFSIGPLPLPRNMSAAVPFAMILAAAALDALFVGLRSVGAGAVLTATALAIGMWGVTMSWRVAEVRSGFAQAASYLRAHGGVPVLTTTEIMAFYLRGPTSGCDLLGLPRTVSDLSAYVAAGYGYAVLEGHHNSAVTWFIRKDARRLAQFSADGAPSIGESLISSENANPPRPSGRPEYVDVYALTGMHLPPVHGIPLHRCNLDHVPP